MTGEPERALPLAGRTAVVTGGGRGIGAALSIGLAAAGASVVAVGRTAGPLEETCTQIRDLAGQAVSVVADISVAADRERIIAQALAEFGRLDVLVNNAAVLRPHDTLRVSEAELDEIFAVNLKGPVFLSQLAFPHLAANQVGSIINFTALGAYQPMAGIGAYCAVKAALVNWTSTMAKEWTPRGVRVNSLVPGPVGTEMILPRDETARTGFVAEMSAQTLVGRIAEPADLVDSVVYLAGDSSRFMTGRSLFLDGGMLA